MNKIQNSEIAQKFNQVADLLEIEGANPFRIRAYRNAARTLLELTQSVADTIDNHGDLTELPGIGKDLSNKIEEIVTTGHFSLLDSVQKKTPLFLREYLKIPGLGPKRVQQLAQFLTKNISQKELDANPLENLKKFIYSDEVLNLKSFGVKTRSQIIQALEKKSSINPNSSSRIRLDEAESQAKPLLIYLNENSLIIQVVVAGSFRRRQESIGDLDILISTNQNLKTTQTLIDYFLKYSEISTVLSHGSVRSTVILRSGLQVDLRVISENSFGAALLYFTGSKNHNIALRKLALDQGYKLNEYGLFKNQQNVISKTEAEIYQKLQLFYIEPELRENKGELEAAKENHLPHLICQNELRGDLHLHTSSTDGSNSLIEMVTEAQKFGYDYIAITDHSKRLTIAHGLDSKKLIQQINEIDLLNTKLKNFTVFKSCEVDILEDGSLDFPDEILKKLDFTVCAIHSRFKLSKEKQTERIIKAMNNPYFKILAHPTGRLINEREPYAIDMEKIIAAAAQRKRVLEINSQPERMDLNDQYCRMAKEHGVKLVISTDAHSTNQLNNITYGLSQARRG